MLTIHVENITSKFSESPSIEIVEAIRDQLKYKNDANNPFIRKKFSRKNVEISEWKYLFHKGKNSFPSGLLDVVEKILNKHKVKYEIVDHRPEYPITNPLQLQTYKLRDYQLDAEAAAIANKNCIIKIATGGGKTAIMASLAAKFHNYNHIIVVRRQMLLAQTIEIFKRELGIEIGQIGAGVVNIKPLTIAMIPTMARAVDPKWKFSKENDDDEDDQTALSQQQKDQIKLYLQQCQLLTIDECHSIASDTCQLVTKVAKNARYRWGFSATPFRDDGKDILLNATTGPRVVDISASLLIEKGYLVPPYIYFFKTPPVRIPTWQQGQYQDVYKEFIVENQSRNQLIVDKTIEAYNRFEKVLILVRQIEHGRLIEEALLDQGVWVDYLSGKDSPSKRSQVMKQFTTRTRSVLIGSDGIMSEGIDLPAISVLINASGGRSSVMYYQKIGRAIRLAKDKKRAIIIDFLDQNVRYLENQAKARMRFIHVEPLYKLKKQIT